MNKRLLTMLGTLTIAGLIGLPVYAQFSISDEYRLVGYEEAAVDNPVARLAERLNSGEQELVFEERHGYFKSLLAALDIDLSSQLLVFSPTSLQHRLISPETPRALYFNEHTYIGFVQNSSIIEVTTIDEKLGVVFYTFENVKVDSRYFERANQACLVCHDTQGTMGGGVPMLMTLSSVYSKNNVPIKSYSGIGNVVDSTPVRDRWGGWYVTGRHGLQPHLGNLMIDSATELDRLNDHRVWNLETTADIDRLDESLYDSNTSDIVALMVLEHQVTVQNQITYVRFKAPAVLYRRDMAESINAESWDALPTEAKRALRRMLNNLVDSIFFVDAAPLADHISGSAEFAEDFQSRGPVDSRGRTLREFDLDKTLFRYPFSYLVYTDDFDALPPYAKDYVHYRIAEILTVGNSSDAYNHVSDADRKAIREILSDTKPDMIPYLQADFTGTRLWR